ncbi:MAG: aminoglycoside 6-adenylyltransferase [Terriglobia bacterium]
MRTESEVLAQIATWAQGNDLVRAAILTGSRVDPKPKTDFLSDYDIALYVADLRSFKQDDVWLNVFGSIMVRWPLEPRSTFDDKWLTRLVLFRDGVRIDFQITDENRVDPSAYDNGYQVLIDKDALAADINDPTFTEYLIRKPSRQEYETLVHDFWWEATYVPKYLWRGELPFAKYMFETVLRYAYFQRVVEWYIGQRQDWKVSTGLYGKWFKRYLDAETWSELESTYAGSGIDENWEAFFRMVNLFRKLAREVGMQLGYEYPINTDEAITKYCSTIREMGKTDDANNRIQADARTSRR